VVGTLDISQSAALGELAHREGLELVLLFGSRARGTETASSDTDLGIRARTGPIGAGCMERLFATLSHVTGWPDVHLIDLARAPALLRFDAARHGVVLYEDRPGRFAEFHVYAWKQMLDDEIDFGPAARQATSDALERWQR
jgi:predicted nucleotidyltransferase